RSEPSTDSQNCCGSRSPRLTVTHAALPAAPAWLIHDRSRTVFPLPGGADTTVTRADVPSRSNSLGRETIPPAPGPATPPATVSDPTAGPMSPIIAPREPTWPGYRTRNADRRHAISQSCSPGSVRGVRWSEGAFGEVMRELGGAPQVTRPRVTRQARGVRKSA